MALTIKQIDKGLSSLYRRYRDEPKVTKDSLMDINKFLSEAINELTLLDMREGKKNALEAKQKKEESNEEETSINNQISMIRALKMNNPLWDIE